MFKPGMSLVFSGVMFACAFSAGAQNVAVGFSPEGTAEPLVINVINAAQHDIRLAGYSFTSPDIAQALVNAQARGVDVRMVLDAHANADTRNHKALEDISIHKISVRISDAWAAMHDKFMVIDGQTVETGSFNYSRSADTRNTENVLVIQDMPALAGRYLTHWKTLWKSGRNYSPAD